MRDGENEAPDMMYLALWIVACVVVLWAVCAALELVGWFVGACADAVSGDGKSVLDRELDEMSQADAERWRTRYGL